MKKAVVIGILALAVIILVLVFFRHRLFASAIVRQECAGDPNFAECAQLEARAEQKCYGRENIPDCLRELDLPIDEPQLTVTHGTPIPP